MIKVHICRRLEWDDNIIKLTPKRSESLGYEQHNDGGREAAGEYEIMRIIKLMQRNCLYFVQLEAKILNGIL